MDVAIFGVIVADLIAKPLNLHSPPPRGGLTTLDSLTLTTGGNVCNVGISLARLGLSVAGAGMVGDDLLGRAVLERLQAERVDVSGISISDRAQTSATVVAVDSAGERTFFHAPGVTELLNANAFRAAFDLIRRCSWLHIGYFGLLPALTSELPRLLTELKQTAPGTQIAMDTLDPPADRSLLEPILPLLDVFAPSRPEAIALTGEQNPKKMIASFRHHMPRGIIAIKLDQDGCILDDTKSAIHIDAYPVNVVDSTGAGDAWFAGLITGLRNNLPLTDCGKLGNRVAADCCTGLGGSAGVQPFSQTMSRLE